MIFDKEMFGLHSPNIAVKNNDMSDFGSDNSGAEFAEGSSTNGIASGDASVGGADAGKGDACGNANGADCGMSM
ncbi:MAG: hypothetical protein IJY06_09480 [Oscillospiraceae bacterium]|nr:hypothetical protein [Oscillospiraceae bacterium]